MTDWVRMKHKETGGTTAVSPRSVDSYKRRGWELEANESPKPSTPAPDVRPRAPKPKDPADKPESDSNESKEDG